MKKLSLADAFRMEGETVTLSNGYSVDIKPWVGYQAAQLWPPIKLAMEEFSSEEGKKTEMSFVAIIDKLVESKLELVWDILLGTLRSPGTQMISESGKEIVDLEHATVEDLSGFLPMEDTVLLLKNIWGVCILPLLQKVGMMNPTKEEDEEEEEPKKKRTRPRVLASSEQEAG